MTRYFRLRLPGAFLLGLLAGALGHALYVRPPSTPTVEDQVERIMTVSPTVTYEPRVVSRLAPMPR